VSLVPRTAQCLLHRVDCSNQGTDYFRFMCGLGVKNLTYLGTYFNRA